VPTRPHRCRALSLHAPDSHDFAYVFWPVIYRGSFSTALWWAVWPLRSRQWCCLPIATGRGDRLSVPPPRHLHRSDGCHRQARHSGAARQEQSGTRDFTTHHYA
jgi:hypothetical protein